MHELLSMMPYESDDDEDMAIWTMSEHLEHDFRTAYETAQCMPLEKVYIPIISAFTGPKTLTAAAAGTVKSATRAITSIGYTFAVVLMAMAITGITPMHGPHGPMDEVTAGGAHDLLDQGKRFATHAILDLASTYPGLGPSLIARYLPQVKAACGSVANILPRNHTTISILICILR
jgi:hypothetical protein